MPTADQDVVAFEVVEALSETLTGTVCLVAGRRVCLPRRYLRDAGIQKPGDRETVRLSFAVAASLGLLERRS